MKKQVITIVAVTMFFATLAVASVHAQNAGTMLVTIPFDFAVSGKTLPAGEYFVQRSATGARLVTQIRNRDKAEGIYLPQTHPVTGGEIQAQSKLVFNKYGDQYFLSQVWIAGRSSGEELTRTGKECSLQRQMAKGKTKAETITIAARAN